MQNVTECMTKGIFPKIRKTPQAPDITSKRILYVLYSDGFGRENLQNQFIHTVRKASLSNQSIFILTRFIIRILHSNSFRYRYLFRFSIEGTSYALANFLLI